MSDLEDLVTRCEKCAAQIPTAGRGRRRPPRHCDRCQLDIVITADQVPAIGRSSCVVCETTLWGRRSHAMTCSTKCRVYLSRLRRARGFLERMARYQQAG